MRRAGSDGHIEAGKGVARCAVMAASGLCSPDSSLVRDQVGAVHI